MAQLRAVFRWVTLLFIGIFMLGTGAILGTDRGYLVIVLFVAGFIGLVLLTEKFRR